MANTEVAELMERLLIVTPLPVKPLDPGFLPPGHAANNRLQAALEIALDLKTTHAGVVLKPHAFAVVDLTTDFRDSIDCSRTPAYAGWNDTEQRRIASLAKLLALYGAYQLRATLRDSSRGLPKSSLTALADYIRSAYQRKGAVTTRPRIEKAFELGAHGDVNFTRADKTDLDLSVKHADVHDDRCPPWAFRIQDSYGLLSSDGPLDFELNDLSFREHLRLMSGWSDNVSAAVVIESLGFPYLWALANQSGLFRPKWNPQKSGDLGSSGPSGLFIGADFNGTQWMKQGGRPTSPPSPPLDSDHQGTARSIAILLTMLGQDRLIDHEAGVGMREMLRQPSSFLGRAVCAEKSPIGIGMVTPQGSWTVPPQAPWRPFDSLPLPKWDPTAPLSISKIGLLPPPKPPKKDIKPLVCNGLLIRSPRKTALGGTVMITAVLVGINNVDNDSTPLQEFGRRMAIALDEIHDGKHQI